MRCLIASILFATFATAAEPDADKAKAATLKYLGSLYDSDSGGYANEQKGKPSLRATNAGVKAIKYLGGKPAEAEKTAKFVLGCYDEKTGAFAEPGGKPDVTTTCVGVMAAMELGIEKEKVARAKTFLEESAKTFEEVRIAAAAVEAWGGPKDWKQETMVAWMKLALETTIGETFNREAKDSARAGASGAVVLIRLGIVDAAGDKATLERLREGQRDDGGWGKAGEKASDMETVYRVMRAFHMLKAKPNDVVKLREFVAKHRNDDGGYAAKPGEKSSATGTYYAVTVTKWLDEFEKK